MSETPLERQYRIEPPDNAANSLAASSIVGAATAPVPASSSCRCRGAESNDIPKERGLAVPGGVSCLDLKDGNLETGGWHLETGSLIESSGPDRPHTREGGQRVTVPCRVAAHQLEESCGQVRPSHAVHHAGRYPLAEQGAAVGPRDRPEESVCAGGSEGHAGGHMSDERQLPSMRQRVDWAYQALKNALLHVESGGDVYVDEVKLAKQHLEKALGIEESE